MSEADLRSLLCQLAKSLFDRGFSVGSAGNISARLPDGGYLMTPTNSSLGRLDPARLSRLGPNFAHLDGDKPSKEVFMHRAFYAARGTACGAVVHLHSTHATAIGCLAKTNPDNPIPCLTPYFVMRVGRSLPLLPYYRPGDPAMEPAIAAAAHAAKAVLLANHGPVVSGATLPDAVHAAEELEEAARLAMLLKGHETRPLTPGEIDDLLRQSI
jgi:ribulose-5-phosphate 4-epimerase/fuculose-1-phosphate aldolase